MKRYIYTCLFLIFFSTPSQASSWQATQKINVVLGALNNGTDVVSDGANAYACLIEDNAGQYKVFVKKYDANTQTWTRLGLPLANSASSCTIALNNSGYPVVAYDVFGSDIMVKEWNGAVWKRLGASRLNIAQLGTSPKIAIENANIYVTWSELDHTVVNANDPSITDSYYTVYASYWDGVHWINLGGAITNTNDWARATSVTIMNGTPYVAYLLDNGNTFADVVYWDGASWASLGGNFGWSELQLANDGTNLVAVNAVTAHVNAFQLDNATQTWIALGGDINIPQSIVGDVDISIYNGIPYVVLGETGKIAVKYWDGANWQWMGSKYLNFDQNKTVNQVALSTEDGTNIHVVWQEIGRSGSWVANSAIWY